MPSQSGRQKFTESCDRGVVSLLEGCSDCNRLTLTQLLTNKDEQPNYTRHSDTANSYWLLAVEAGVAVAWFAEQQGTTALPLPANKQHNP